jgi:O-antigen/teichoic acid export membrane protein
MNILSKSGANVAAGCNQPPPRDSRASTLVHQSVERRTLSATVSGIVSFIVTFAQSTVLVPILLTYWGREKYGVWVAIAAFVALTQTVDAGHQTFVGNEMNLAYFTSREQLRRIIASSLWIGVALSSIAAFIVIGLPAPLLGKLIGVGEVAQYAESKISVIILVCSWVMTGSYSGILVRLFVPAGLLTENIWWAIALRLLNMGSLIVTIELGGGIKAAALVSSACNVALTAVLLVRISRRFADLRPYFRGGSVALGFRNFGRSLVTSCANTTIQLQTSWLVLIIAASAGAQRVPTFSTMKTLTNAFVQITSIVSIAVMPELIRYHARGEGQKFGAALSATWLGSGTAVNLLVVGTLPFMESAYGWWTHRAIAFDWVLYGCFAASVAFRNLGAPIAGYLNGINHLKAQSAIAASAILALGLAGGALYFFGFLGLGISLLVGDVITAFIVPFVFVFRGAASSRMAVNGAHLGINLISVAVVCACVFLAANGIFPARMVSMAGVICISALAVRQYLDLPESVKARFGALVERF